MTGGIQGFDPRAPLPELRAELQLLSGAPGATGEPAWLVHDPLNNRFIQIDVAAYETLRHWKESASGADLVGRVNAAGRVRIEPDDVDVLLRFLDGHRLTAEPLRNGWRGLARAGAARRHSLLTTLLHNYLFFRIPLWRPQAFLERTLPLARMLASGSVIVAIWVMGLVGLYLVSRQWDAYIGTFQGFLAWEGLVISAVVLGFVKAAHELGHAYTAAAFGCRVHTMGVAFMMMAPLLYTDVTDSWRLTDRHKRFLIDSAGIAVELAIAAVALFAWAFLPEGAMRSSAFVLSAVSVASSLAINLNPFMRFDGYYLLSEAVGVENLQPRAFALGRWQLRELLFGLGAQAPEVLPRALSRFLIVYAWAVWIYRLVLFTGIALVVYHYFFKALGIILFAVEIGYFILRPVVSEMAVWHRHRRRIGGTRRAALTAGVAVLGLASLLVPWSTTVEIPAVIEGAHLRRIHPLRPSKVEVVHVSQGADVRSGDPIVSLSSPDIEHELEVLGTKLSAARLQYGRRGADGEDRANSLVLESAISGLVQRIEGLEKERAELVVRAPFDGKLVELDSAIHAGRWVSPRDLLATIVAPGEVVAKGYVSEGDLWRIDRGTTGRFIPEHPLRGSIEFSIGEVAASGAAEIEIADLASVNGGRIAVNSDTKRRLAPVAAQYLVHMKAVSAPGGSELRLRGVMLADGRPESLLARVWRQTLKVLVRESGA